MTKDQARSLSLITGGVLAAGTLLTHHYTTSTQHFAAEKGTFDIGKRLFIITVLVLVMSIMADQIPDFAGPFALLVMVAYISTHLDVFNEFAQREHK